jgi:hypothetical protein
MFESISFGLVCPVVVPSPNCPKVLVPHANSPLVINDKSYIVERCCANYITINTKSSS